MVDLLGLLVFTREIEKKMKGFCERREEKRDGARLTGLYLGSGPSMRKVCLLVDLCQWLSSSLKIVSLFLFAEIHDSRQCSFNYPDKYIPMAMPMDINSGMPMGGMGRKKRDEGRASGWEIGSEIGSGMGREIGSGIGSVIGIEGGSDTGEVTPAGSLEECSLACVQQVGALIQIQEVKI